MMGDKNLRVPSTTPPSGSPATRRETRGDFDGRQELARCRDAPQHHPVPNLQKGRQEQVLMGEELASFRDPRHHQPAPKLQEGRQEEIMTGGQNLRVFGTPGTTIRFPKYKKGDKRRWETRTYEFLGPPAPKLQEGRQEEIMMGDKNLRAPRQEEILMGDKTS